MNSCHGRGIPPQKRWPRKQLAPLQTTRGQRLDSSHDKEFSERLRSWLSRELPGFLTREGDRALLADLIAPKIAH